MHRSSQQAADFFAEKYSTYGDMIYKICMIYLCNREDAEEAMQESFFKLIYRSPQFIDDEHEKAWLIRVTTNICKDVLRSIWRKRVVKMEDFEGFYDNPSSTNIMEEIMKLPAKYKEVIYLYYYEDYAVRRIAELLKISESAVKMRLMRGREILKIEMEGDSYE